MATLAEVLVDAPCSQTGALRRNPDMKWTAPYCAARVSGSHGCATVPAQCQPCFVGAVAQTRPEQCLSAMGGLAVETEAVREEAWLHAAEEKFRPTAPCRAETRMSTRGSRRLRHLSLLCSSLPCVLHQSELCRPSTILKAVNPRSAAQMALRAQTLAELVAMLKRTKPHRIIQA